MRTDAGTARGAMAACAVQAGLVRETVGFARERSCAKTFCRRGIAGRRGQRRSSIRLRVLHLRGVVNAIPAFDPAASDQTAKAEQSKGGFTCDARRAKIDSELGDPVIGLCGVDQHLLNSPVTFVFGGRDVGVTQVTRFGIQSKARVLDVVSLPCAPETLSGP